MDNNEKKTAFNEALEYLVESANINNGTLTVDEIRLAFDGMIEDETLYQPIYDYMTQKNIHVEGYTPSSKRLDKLESVTAAKSIDAKEHNIIEMYLSEINHTKGFTEPEEYEMLNKYLSDHMNRDCINVLTEMNLKLVPPIADDFTEQGVLYSDLLQEGNLGLIESIMTFRGNNDLNDFHQHIKDAIRNAMKDAILEQNASSRIGTHAADRANELDRASVHLSKELDRTPTLSELSKYLALPEDEVEQIMKMSLNALTIHEDVEE